MTSELHRKYRPDALDGIIGQDAVCASIEKVLDKGTAHSFIFYGPSGVGKTTAARIVARMLDCDARNIIEVDAATHTGVDAMRQITDGLNYAALGSSKIRVYIIDEAHMLSKSAWNSLLKAVEEPPQHVYWVFCTTEGGKIPATIKTRCAEYTFSAVDEDLIHELLVQICEEEDLETGDDVLDLIVDRSQGSVRRALTYLSMAADCESRKEAALVLATHDEGGEEVISLCRAMAKGTSWPAAMKVISPMSGANDYESVRRVVNAYFSKMAMGGKNDKSVQRALDVLFAFKDPYPSNSGIAPLLLSIATVVYGD